jgi:hypothetical protein
MRENGFYLMNEHPREQIIGAGQYQIFIFSCVFTEQKAEDYVFPPQGFRISRIA